MKQRIILFCILISVLIISSFIVAFAEDYGVIQVDALKAIEAKDSFPVKIIEKSVTLNGASRMSLLDDLLIFRVENSDSQSIRDIVMYVVSYDETFAPTKLSIGTILSTDSFVQVLTTTNTDDDVVTINAGSTEKLQMDCQAANVAGIRAIVASYVTEDGGIHHNPLIEEWLNSVTGDRITELD